MVSRSFTTPLSNHCLWTPTATKRPLRHAHETAQVNKYENVTDGKDKTPLLSRDKTHSLIVLHQLPSDCLDKKNDLENEFLFKYDMTYDLELRLPQNYRRFIM